MTKLRLFENIIVLTIAGIVNASIMIMVAAAFYSHGSTIFSIFEAFKTLVPLFGSLSTIIFLFTLFHQVFHHPL